ncbi:hypothetical protein P8941_13110 [Enterococcus faecium]|uniref:hypothetical protein n=1 Tax=Enterococcus faecium TaxID=1352 RepID=UPI00241407DC|nr:hypothetical protein [Enterococcus faecium]MDG4625474.1 hypothetical protein [Enterococcus faecium]
MSNLENKEEKVVNKIVSVVNKLDKELDELDTLSENPEKKHNLKKWLVERKAIHEIIICQIKLDKSSFVT